MQEMHLLRSTTKLSTLELKNWPDKFLGYLPLAFTLTLKIPSKNVNKTKNNFLEVSAAM
jgi:hypothetical protein